MNEKPKQNPAEVRKGCTILAVAAVVIFLSFKFGCSSDKEEKAKPATEQAEKRNYKEEAYQFSQQYAKQNIKSPSSAVFAPISEASIQRYNDSTYIVKSYLDAQNSYGAMLRADYSCIITLKKDGSGQGNEFTITNR